MQRKDSDAEHQPLRFKICGLTLLMWLGSVTDSALAPAYCVRQNGSVLLAEDAFRILQGPSGSLF